MFRRSTETHPMRIPLNNRVLATVALAAALLAGPAAAEPLPIEADKIGIATPKVGEGVKNAADANGVANGLQQVMDAFDGQLVTQIGDTGKFQVVGRSDLDRILEEQGLAASGNVDAGDEQAAQSFMLAGCKYLCVVTIDGYDEQRDVRAGEGGRTKAEVRLLTVAATIKTYETTGAKLLKSTSEQIELRESTNDRFGPANFSKMYRDAAVKLAEAATLRVADSIFPSRVLAFRNGLVTIDVGGDAGAETGQIWTVYFVDPEPVVHPRTGKEFFIETPLCEIEVVRVMPDFAQAKLVGDDPGVEADMVVRLGTLDGAAAGE